MRSTFVAMVLFAGCGRIGFDASAGDGGTTDDTVDGALPANMIAVPVVAAPFDFAVGTPWKQATLTRPFALDRDEVTVGRWMEYVAAGLVVPSDNASLDPTGHYAMRWHATWNTAVADPGYSTPCGSPWAIEGSTYPTGNPDLPMSCITWMQAVAFCAWDGGKRLPTALEWNYEARGGTGGVGDHRPYVWGTAVPDCAHATSDDTATQFCNYPTAVGSAPSGASAHGARDLNGSIWEWGWDATGLGTLSPTSDDVPPDAVDFIGPDLGTSTTINHALFGGEWGEMQDNMNLVSGNNHSPGCSWPGDDIITTVGFRCAKTL